MKNATTTTATAPALEVARNYFAAGTHATITTREDIQALVNHWNALGDSDRTPELRTDIEAALGSLSDKLHTAEAERLACYHGAELFRVLFSAPIPATANTRETPRAEHKRVLSAVSAPAYRPRFKDDGTLEVRITPRQIKMRHILDAKERMLTNSRPDRHTEKTDAATAWAQVFTADIEAAIITAIACAERCKTNADTIPAVNSRTRSAIETTLENIPADARNAFSLNSRTATQAQVRALVAIITDDSGLASAWNKRTAGNLYAEIHAVKRGAEISASVLQACDIFADNAHIVTHGRPIVIDGAGIHSADKSAPIDEFTIR